MNKAIRDLLINKARTLLVVMAIAIGICGVGFILNSYTILTREMNKNYLDTTPASFTLYTDNINDKLLRDLHTLPAIKEAEARKTVMARVRVKSGDWRMLRLYVIEDFNNVRVDIMRPEKGTRLPATGEILMERDAFEVADTQTGAAVTVKIPFGQGRDLNVTGGAHAPGLAPASQENMAYGFITAGTLRLLGDNTGLDQLRIVVAEKPFDREHIKKTAYAVRDWVEKNGHPVARVEIPEPGRHPHADQLAAFLFLLQVFGLLALVLSGFLVINMITALLAGQIRQIGIMKAVGAKNSQVAGIYFGTVLLLSLTALALAMPVSIWAARAYAAIGAKILNFTITSYAIPFWAFAMQITAGLLIPLAAAACPIIKGSRVTVLQAISDYGITNAAAGGGVIDRLSGKLSGLGRPLLLSIRNTFRKRGRLALTLGTLISGGALFVVTVNIWFSTQSTVDNAFKAKNHDLEIVFSKPYPIKSIEDTIKSLPGVNRVEAWGSSPGTLVNADGTEGAAFTVLARPADAKAINSPALAGRWTGPEDRQGIVINHTFLEKAPGLEVGDKVTLKVKGQTAEWKITGIVREVGSPPAVYVNYDDYAGKFGRAGDGNHVFIATDSANDIERQKAIFRAVEDSLAKVGLDVSERRDIPWFKQVFQDHLKIIVLFLLVMSILTLAIGGLGLATTMGMNVMERMRELAVMRAMGATPRDIMKIVMAEGILTGLMSWLAAAALSIPLTVIIGNIFGRIFLHTPLDLVITPVGILIWLFTVVAITAAAGCIPARKATRLPVHEILAYE